MVKIFVSVGTHPQDFKRLFEELDKISEKKVFGGIFAQTGNSKYAPKNFKFKNFLDAREYNEQIKKADIVISHGGAGTIINALKEGKTVIIVPRLKQFGEHTDDHQIDLAKAMENEKKAIAVYDIKNLEKAIELAANFKPKLESTREKIIEEMEKFAKSNF